MNNAVSLEFHSLDSGVEAVVQPERAVRRDGCDVGVIAKKSVRFLVLTPLAVAQSPQPVGIGDPHGPLLVFGKGPRPVFQRHRLMNALKMDALEASRRRRPVAAEDYAGCRSAQPGQLVDETAGRSRAWEPVRLAEQPNLSGCRIDARHATWLNNRPYGAAGS